jgi:hypothetical protein
VRHIERTFEEGFDYDTAIVQAYQLLNMPALNIFYVIVTFDTVQLIFNQVHVVCKFNW